MAEIVIAHRDRLRPWQPEDENSRTFSYLVEQRRNGRTRLSNRLTALLKGSFPQVLQWFSDVRTTLVCNFMTRWRPLQAVKRARQRTLKKFFREHDSNRKHMVESRIKAIKEGIPLTTDKAVIKASALMAQALAGQ